MTAKDDRSDTEGEKDGSDSRTPTPEVSDATRLWEGEPSNPDEEIVATRVYEPPSDTSEEAPSTRSRQIAPGTVLFGEYVIEEVLGSGGMGEVYKAQHRALGEFRAIKVLHAEISEKKATAALFLREAKALLSVRHPAVVHCHDLLSDEDGRVFLIMELIQGLPLTQRMAKGPLSTDEVAVLGGRLAAGLHAAHARGVVHRDISPDNIVLEDGDVARAKLIDFGIAKLLESGQGTVVDGFKGKLSYASPEQLGFFGGRIDGRSDLYSLGLVLCAASLGHPIGMGKTVVEAVDARRSLQALPDQIPVGLRSALAPLLALDPADRPERAERLFLAADSLGGLPPLATSSRSPRNRAAPMPLFGGALLVLLLLGFVGYWLVGGGEPSQDGASASAGGDVLRGDVVASQSGSALSPSAGAEARAVVDKASEPAISDPPGAVARVVPSALDELKIMGLLRGAQDALAEDRLRRPPGQNAFEKYQAVLKLDPANAAAKEGLSRVAGRYLALAKSALSKDDLEEAAHYLSEAIQVAPRHPGIASVQAALASAGQ
ncbi:MAG: serine/threonine-protein kinase [Myxococcota bacterium]|nr:serine/threonine-protein kinase [Myxococcota bacterium]